MFVARARSHWDQKGQYAQSTIRTFVQSVCLRMELDFLCLLTAMLYMERLRTKFPDSGASSCVRRVFTMGLLTASKYHKVWALAAHVRERPLVCLALLRFYSGSGQKFRTIRITTVYFSDSIEPIFQTSTLLLTGDIRSNKTKQDNPYDNKSWARLCDIGLVTMNGMELQFLEALAFELYVDASHVTELLDCIEAEHVCRHSIPRIRSYGSSTRTSFKLYGSQCSVLTWVPLVFLTGRVAA